MKRPCPFSKEVSDAAFHLFEVWSVILQMSDDWDLPMISSTKIYDGCAKMSRTFYKCNTFMSLVVIKWPSFLPSKIKIGESWDLMFENIFIQNEIFKHQIVVITVAVEGLAQKWKR